MLYIVKHPFQGSLKLQQLNSELWQHILRIYRVADCLPAAIMRLSALACKCGIWECLFLCVSSCLSGCQSACVWPRGCGPSSPFTNNIYAVYGCYWLETTGLKLKLLHQRPQPNGAAEATKIGSYCSPRCRAPQRRKGSHTPSPLLAASLFLTRSELDWDETMKRVWRRVDVPEKRKEKKLKFIFMQHINFDFSARAMFVLVFIVRTCACLAYEICM